MLTGFAGALGVGIAFAGLRLLTHAQPANLPRLADIRVDMRVLLFTSGLLLLTALLSGLAPALHAARQSIGNLLGGARVANHGKQPMARNALIVAEVALSVVLLVGAGLLAQSFLHLQAVRPGFVAENTLSFHLALPREAYPSFDERRAFTSTLLGQLGECPA